MNFITFLSLNAMILGIVTTGIQVTVDCPVVGVPLIALGCVGFIANAFQFFASK